VNQDKEIHIIGGGLAGCEAAWQAAKAGCWVFLYEMKPDLFSPAHNSQNLAELVCSNSLRSDSLENASGVLKEELRRLGSLIVEQAEKTRVPAGGALAVDREQFSESITRQVEGHPGITVVRGEIKEIPRDKTVIIASGPLTSDCLADDIKKITGDEFLYFHDAIAPIIEADSIDNEKTFAASRYDKGEADYINCPMSKEEYYRFIEELNNSEKVPLKDFETLTPFEGCMPVEVMAERGIETLAHGPMKPVGLIDPGTGLQPYAVVQLRQENREASIYNIVGFQTRLKWPEQKRVFGLIPGLENTVFVRYGSLHRNTFIHSPEILKTTLQTKKMPNIFFAGQITGVEGYIESTSTGLIAGITASRYVMGLDTDVPPPTTVTGGLLSYITDLTVKKFQPMNANFGILPSLEKRAPKKIRKKLYGERALADIDSWKKSL
jgi:methylenetetrahydrofolate--tRNA-(uracil-5-)-methyltransferase